MPAQIETISYITRSCAGLLSVAMTCIYAWLLVSVPAVGICFGDEAGSGAAWRILADQMQYDKATETFIASGNVTISRPGRRLSADFIRYDRENQTADAQGNVVLETGGDILKGDAAEVDLETETGTLYEGNLFIRANQFHIKAERIEKTGENTYFAREASITSCDGDVPDWYLSGSEVTVEVEGFGTVRHAALWARKLPLLYSPFLFFPAKTKRQSGFLMPDMRLSSDRKGFGYNQPYFWAIRDNLDATIYGHYMAERGAKIGGEFRYVASAHSQGAIMVDYLKDRRVDDGTAENSRWGYDQDAYDRPNESRSWFRMKHDQDFGRGVKAKLDLDIVSDQDYLLEFDERYTGYEAVNAYFIDTFGRGVDDYNQTVRKNQLAVSKAWTAYSMNADLRWYDNVIARRWQNRDTTLKRLPYVQFDAVKQQIGESGFYGDIDSEYTYFYRINGDKGHRVDVHPRMYHPLSYRRYFRLEPSVGVRETAWIEAPDNAEETAQEVFSREMYDVKIDLSTEIFRIFDIGGEGSGGRLKHSIRPQVIYSFIPEVRQDPFPEFDYLDRIGKRNAITYSITQTFTAKRSSEAALPSSGSSNGPDARKPVYSEICYFKISQSYDISRSYDLSRFSDLDAGVLSDAPKPFSAIRGELEFGMSPWITLRADSDWDLYSRRFTTCDTGLRLGDDRGDWLKVGYYYTRDDARSVRMDFNVVLNRLISIYGLSERNLEDGKNIETGLGLRYTSQCWSLDAVFLEKEDDSEVGVMIHLFGLGEAETSIGGF